jgi:Ni,Fe-hydrogenase III small subunit
VGKGTFREIARRLGQRPARLGAPAAGEGAARAVARRNRGSLQLRQVDAGSCNGCELEIASCFSPIYDAERFGIRLEASPRHADGLLVTGPVTHNMADPLRKTYEAVPEPKVVVAVGDCARDCGVFRGAYGLAGAVSEVVPVDVEIPGCPPEPEAIIAALRSLSGR